MRALPISPGRTVGRAARVAAAALLVILASCAEEEPPAEGTTGKAAESAEEKTADGSSGRAERVGPDPASGVLKPGDGKSEPPPDPRKIGLEPAAGVSTDPSLAAESSSGSASAYWGRRGRRVDARTPWRSIAGDGLHDRGTEAVRLLQSPSAAFRKFPRANSGNLVDWVAAMDQGHIRPRGGKRLEVLDRDVLMVDTKNMPYVIFPHRPHTEQLVCRNCHDWLFKKQAGTTEITMRSIARGRSCGLCHGKVAFPATECFRCHSGPRPR